MPNAMNSAFHFKPVFKEFPSVSLAGQGIACDLNGKIVSGILTKRGFLRDGGHPAMA
jgi:hypothetical protein